MATGTDIIARGMAGKAISALDKKADLVNGKVPAEQLPSYIDDIIEVEDYQHLPIPGEAGKIYVTLDNNKSYRWSGSAYVEIPSLDQVYTKQETDALLAQKQNQLSAGKYIDIDENNVISVIDKPYLSLERLRSYAYQVTFDTLPSFNPEVPPVIGGCTSYVANNRLYRNFDWGYNEGATFKVIGKGFTGNAMIKGLTDQNLDDDLIGQLPYHLLDGRNDAGIMVASHVLFNDWEWHGDGNIPMYEIPYIILSQINTMQQFAADMPEILNNLQSVPMLEEMGYLMQFIVTDGTTTYVIVPPTNSSGKYVIIDATNNPKLTNFRWAADKQVERQDLQLHPTGVERWNMIPCSLEELKFTDCYLAPNRLSEFIGLSGTTKDTPDSELMVLYNAARGLYERRTRDGETWQTVHSVIYGPGGMESLCVQENFDEDFCAKDKLIAGDGIEITEKGVINVTQIKASQVIYNKNTIVAQDVGGLKTGFMLTGHTIENILERLVGAYIPPVFTNTTGEGAYTVINKRTGTTGGYYMGDTAALSNVTITIAKGTDFDGIVSGDVYINSSSVYTLSEENINALNDDSVLELELSNAEYTFPANQTSKTMTYGVHLKYNKKSYDSNENIVITVTPLSIQGGELTVRDSATYKKVYYGAIAEGIDVSNLSPNGEITYGDYTKTLNNKNALGDVIITTTDEENCGVIISDQELQDIKFMTNSDIANWSKQEIIASYVRPNSSVFTKNYYVYYRTMATGSFTYVLN